MSFCDHCIRGVTHEGTPKGEFKVIGGVNTYVATPSKDYPKNKAVLYLADIFGPSHINAQLLVDDFAENGFMVYAPDYLNNDPVPDEAFYSGTFDLKEWSSRHGQDVTRPVLDKVIDALKEQGVTLFGATGYCFGGRYVFDLAFDNVIKASVISHPSLLKTPEDLETYYAKSESALLINSCSIDPPFPREACEKADELFGEGKFKPGYRREFFDGCTHGFAVRGDMSDPKVKAGKEGAFKAAVEWFKEHL